MRIPVKFAVCWQIYLLIQAMCSSTIYPRVCLLPSARVPAPLDSRRSPKNRVKGAHFPYVGSLKANAELVRVFHERFGDQLEFA
jgi:hypothetical protein